MPVEYLKRATKSPATGEGDTRAVVREMLAACEGGGEARVREYARALDGWDGEIVVSRAEIEAAGAALSGRMRADIAFAHARVQRFG